VDTQNGVGGLGVKAGGAAQHVASWPLLVLVVLAAVVVHGGGAGRTLHRCIASDWCRFNNLCCTVHAYSHEPKSSMKKCIGS